MGDHDALIEMLLISQVVVWLPHSTPHVQKRGGGIRSMLS
jgi:hypothetical protein